MPTVPINVCPTSYPWVCVFDDSFDGNEINHQYWNIPYQGVLRDFDFIDSKHWFANTGTTPSIPISHNITIDGNLNLIAKKEEPQITGTFVTDWSTSPPTYKTSNFKYSTAEIESRFKFGHGIFEARIKIPKGKGFWPAFWTYSDDPWSEIDIFEFWNEKDVFGGFAPNKLSKIHNTNMHYDYDYDGLTNMCEDEYTGVDFSEDFHIFTVVWGKDKTQWLVDGILKREDHHFHNDLGQVICYLESWIPYVQNLIYPEDPMNIYFTLSIQHGYDTYGNKEPDETTPFPSQIEVDWVRYYKRMPNQIVNIINPSEYTLDDNQYNVIVGTKINFNCNYSINEDQQLKLIASNSIKFQSGFKSKNGSFVEVKIDPELFTSKFSKNIQPEKSIAESNSNSEAVLLRNTSIYVPFEADDNNGIKIFPNPVTNLITIDLNSNDFKNYRIQIFDLYGKQKTLVENISSQKVSIELKLDKGMYILSVVNLINNEIIKKQFVVI
jgi:beta-glucanase (GH16 family)